MRGSRQVCDDAMRHGKQVRADGIGPARTGGRALLHGGRRRAGCHMAGGAGSRAPSSRRGVLSCRRMSTRAGATQPGATRAGATQPAATRAGTARAGRRQPVLAPPPATAKARASGNDPPRRRKREPGPQAASSPPPTARFAAPGRAAAPRAAGSSPAPPCCRGCWWRTGSTGPWPRGGRCRRTTFAATSRLSR